LPVFHRKMFAAGRIIAASGYGFQVPGRARDAILSP